MSVEQSEEATELARFNMIAQQIRPWDVMEPRVLAALALHLREHTLTREEFVVQRLRGLAGVAGSTRGLDVFHQLRLDATDTGQIVIQTFGGRPNVNGHLELLVVLRRRRGREPRIRQQVERLRRRPRA